ncbi:MAG: hypothetical protein QOG62_1705 [Thermoleophilaceae bacterium]|jgi:glycosyltransferase involved in cell wall biosynthesis|nr:hypothetical protein [Thermoleophilaceae bacterium]
MERISGVRAAIVHDWFQGFHGAERTVEAMRSGLFAPGYEPDILTFHAAHDLLPDELSQAIVRESRLAGLPGIRQVGHDPGRWRYLLPLMPRYYRRLPVGDYDLVISSSHACASHVRPRPGVLHLCYCYTPMRYAWAPDTDGGRLTGVGGLALSALGGSMRRADRRAAQRPDGFIAISQAVRERIQRYYDRDSVVVHPPVDVADVSPGRPKQPGHFLWVHRLVKYKRPDVVAEAFRDLPYTLTMVGVGPMEQTLRESLPPNVELRGWLTRAELAELYESASGFIHIGEEDFGITMVEAMAAGTPVIALNRGGARDIVRDGQDGLLLEEPDPALLRDAVEQVAGRTWDPSALAARAATFSRENFLERMLATIGEFS